MTASMLVGDLHLGAASALGKTIVGSTINGRTQDQMHLLDWLLHQALAHNVSNIKITGDVFDNAKPSSAVVALLLSWLHSCTDQGLSVHLLLGNHDLIRHGVYLSSPLDIVSAANIDNVFVYKNMTTIHDDGISFTMIPFRDRRSFDTLTHNESVKNIENRLQYELAEIDRNSIRVAIGHLALEGAIPALDEIEDTSNELFMPINTFNSFDYTLFGHIHKPQIFNRSPHIAHIGSLDINSFGEAPEQKVAVILDTKNPEVIKYIEIPARRLSQISISVPANITDTTSYVISEIEDQKPYLRKSIAKLSVVLENPDVISIDRDAVEKSLMDAGAFHIVKISEERKTQAIKRSAFSEEFDDTVNELGAIRMFSETVEAEFRDEFVSLANDIVKECAA